MKVAQQFIAGLEFFKKAVPSGTIEMAASRSLIKLRQPM
jgi:hypothetical protein